MFYSPNEWVVRELSSYTLKSISDYGTKRVILPNNDFSITTRIRASYPRKVKTISVSTIIDPVIEVIYNDKHAYDFYYYIKGAPILAHIPISLSIGDFNKKNLRKAEKQGLIKSNYFNILFRYLRKNYPNSIQLKGSYTLAFNLGVPYLVPFSYVNYPNYSFHDSGIDELEEGYVYKDETGSCLYCLENINYLDYLGLYGDLIKVRIMQNENIYLKLNPNIWTVRNIASYNIEYYKRNFTICFKSNYKVKPDIILSNFKDFLLKEGLNSNVIIGETISKKDIVWPNKYSIVNSTSEGHLLLESKHY